jgi:hypothetical protein
VWRDGDPCLAGPATALLDTPDGDDAPVIKARVIRGSKAPLAARQAELMGGVFDAGERVWSFRMTSIFELKGGVRRLRRSGLLPLEMWADGRPEAVWVDYDWGERVMEWRPLP